MKKSKKILSIVLAVVICFSSLFLLTFAEGNVFFKTFYFDDGSANQSFYYHDQSRALHIFNEKEGERILGKINETQADSVPADIRELHIHGSGEITNIFNDLPNLHKVKIYEPVVNIDNSFNNCPELEEVNIEYWARSIKNSFNSCDALERVSFGGDTKVFEDSFNDCRNLGYIYFSGKLRSGDDLFGYFDGYYKDSFNNLNQNGVIWFGTQDFSELSEEQVQNSFMNTEIQYKAITGTTITNFKVSNGKTGVSLTWDNPRGEAKIIYRMGRYDYEDYLFATSGDFRCDHIGQCNCYNPVAYCDNLGKVYVESYVDETVKSGEKYYYYHNEELVGITYLSKPVVTSCVSTASNKATIKWQKVEGAKGYYVYQSTTGKSGSWKKIGNLSADKLSCTATGLKTNTKYYFCVKAYSGKDVSYGTTKTVTVGVPAILSAKKSGENITLKWAQQSNTVYYRIYAKAPGDSAYTRVATIKNPKTTSYTFKQFSKSGTQIKVRAFYTSNGKTTYATTPLYTVK